MGSGQIALLCIAELLVMNLAWLVILKLFVVFYLAFILVSENLIFKFEHLEA